MKSAFSFIRRGEWLTVTLAVVIAVVGVVGLVQAATTISTNVVTEGDLQVDGNSTIGSAVGDSVTANAYFTQLRIGTGSTFGHIGTVGADELGVEGDIEIDGTAYFDGLASTTALKVGDDSDVTTINGMIFGYCTLASVTVVATSTAQTHCTGATGLIANDRVWVMATSSLPAGLVVSAASSTAASIIGVRVTNATAGADTATGAVSLHFWAVRP
ncbi:hypothetical protein A3A38_04450 [Candidatus Kaiserbacteria bacterium RIFCSPLOWO2_01_FULL_53_17]|uniref:Uncharacterized protein n=1 Tax=Candidatus Kaiserbacteria bacterium RIFCSPLOWO2_01_FULL_53_17 TaxID=1798511 RepID=A0A1F6EFZ2_9BACT|nr:MAG: hypothetical protein A3A38_04450 [Candidatus Kaiserbacteria bacterium RIFCSPLOWO2_01_FULL_53_17]